MGMQSDPPTLHPVSRLSEFSGQTLELVPSFRSQDGYRESLFALGRGTVDE